MTRNGGQDRGSVTVETMIAVPVLILVLLLALAAGRVTMAAAAVQAAARDAARQASIARTATTAQSTATSSAMTTLSSSGLHCRSTSVQLDLTGFVTPAGRPATVSAAVRCTVALSDLGFPGLPGAVVKQARWTSALDRYRARDLGLAASMRTVTADRRLG